MFIFSRPMFKQAKNGQSPYRTEFTLMSDKNCILVKKKQVRKHSIYWDPNPLPVNSLDFIRVVITKKNRKSKTFSKIGRDLYSFQHKKHQKYPSNRFETPTCGLGAFFALPTGPQFRSPTISLR